MNFTAPYRFVPLNKHVFCPHLVDGYPENISHDVPFRNGKDGSIDVTFHNVTPILVGGDLHGNKKEPQQVSIGNKSYYIIPGSSWKGMIRSVMEIMSFAKMQPYDNETFGYRNVGAQNDQSYNGKMQAAYCGWLYKEKDDKYYLRPCGKIEPISIDEIRGYNNIKDKNIIEKLRTYNTGRPTKDWAYPKYEGKYLVFTGAINGKKHEYLFEDPNCITTKIDVEKTCVTKFFSVYHNSPYNDEKGKYFIKTWLDYGKYLPVFYLKSSTGVTHIGYTRMFRLPYAHSISDFIKQDSKKEEHDLVECIFGYTDTDNKSSLKGRVQFGHTLVEKRDSTSNNVVGVLGEPKASFFPFYLKQQGNTAQTYDSDAEIAGRKRYAIHADSNLANLPQGNGNENTISRLQFIPAGKDLKFTIHFHNLLPEELGALLSAISFHNTKGIYYNMGMAKGYGYGKLEYKESKLKIVGNENTDKRPFLVKYETVMNRFVQERYNTSWRKSEQMQALFGIASGSIEEANLKTMEMEKRINGGKINEFKQCSDFRTNRGERNLRDWKPQNITSCADSDDQAFQTIDCCACNCLNNKDFDGAIQQWQEIVKRCKNEEYKQYARERIAGVESSLQDMNDLQKKAEQRASEGEYEEAIKCFEEYQTKFGKSVANEIKELKEKIKEQSDIEIKRLLEEADSLKRAGQYAEAIKKYEDYARLSGLSKEQDIQWCSERLKNANKPIVERLTFGHSSAAFINSLKNALAGRQSLTPDEIKAIGQKLSESVKSRDKAKWQRTISDIHFLAEEQVKELLNYLR